MATTTDLVVQTATALETIMSCRRVRSDRALALKAAPLSREMIQKRRVGNTPMTVEDIGRLATALEVPPELFFRDRTAIYDWFAAELRGRGSNSQPTGCESVTPLCGSPARLRLITSDSCQKVKAA